jgi:hypothetical protein
VAWRRWTAHGGYQASELGKLAILSGVAEHGLYMASTRKGCMCIECGRSGLGLVGYGTTGWRWVRGASRAKQNAKARESGKINLRSEAHYVIATTSSTTSPIFNHLGSRCNLAVYSLTSRSQLVAISSECHTEFECTVIHWRKVSSCSCCRLQSLFVLQII